jgi:hypothetical protein
MKISLKRTIAIKRVIRELKEQVRVTWWKRWPDSQMTDVMVQWDFS